MKAWHFLREDRRLGYGDRRIVEAGETLTVDCRPVLCRAGLHASVSPLDALRYAPGPVVCRVQLGGTIVRGDDKVAATERTVLWMYDSSPVLRHFARACALDVIHMWDAPEVVIQYLRTGDESLRDAARAAARDAAWDDAWDAARAAARAAASAAASAAAWDAAGDAAWAAAWDAAGDAAWDAARAAAKDAARAAARDAQERRLYRMLMAGRREHGGEG